MDKNIFGSQFHTEGFNYPYWVDHGEKGGGIMLLFREDLPLNVLFVDKGKEMVLQKTKWLINFSYNPSKNDISDHIESLSQKFNKR